MNTLSKLDIALDATFHQRNYKDLLDYLASQPNMQLDEHNYRLILNKIRDDGYIDFVAGTSITKQSAAEGIEIRRNFEGNLFWESGGYTKRAIDINAENNRIRRNEIATRRLTFAALIFAVPSGFLALADLYKDHGWFQSPYWWKVSLICVCLGSGSYLLYSILKRRAKSQKQPQEQ